MNPKSVKIPLFALPASSSLVPEPLGNVLLFSSWNFPIVLALEPMIGAIAAGNTVALKPSELAPASTQFLADVIPRYLDGCAVKVFVGGAAMGSQLLELAWDKIFFTGSPRVARLVMVAAAKHLTPVILELGGKCPAIFDKLSSSQQEIAARRLVAGKWGPCCGQACIGVDYVLVERRFAQNLIELLRKTVSTMYEDSRNLARVVNQEHFIRLKSLLKDPAVYSSVVFGGGVDNDAMTIEPTILLDPPLDSAIMNEEIFGPLLPIITVENIQDSITFINDRPKPLAIYVFTNDETLRQQVLGGTSSGSVTFNDTMVQFALDTLPFGGVGSSGFGRYHGKFSFDAFTHEKAVMRRHLLLDLPQRYPPWSNLKLDFLRSVYNYDYISLILFTLGLKR
ncbi:aldehyde dehydrogenase family 3 member F1-like isoform X2 [Wolffia australiana]